MTGPLAGVRVLEFEALGPVPFCGMLLADMGADVLIVDRPGGADDEDMRTHVLRRGKRSIVLDLKSPKDVKSAQALAGHADVLIEGMRPGVMERLGLGPEPVRKANSRLVYGRMTGWGRSGPPAASAGHDINFVASTGVLDAIGRAEGGPVPPLNLVGDYGGGGMYLACGLLGALFEAQRTGQGQVVDAAMVDGASLLAAHFHGLIARGEWSAQRATNVLDGGAPWYDVYETGDGRYVAVGAVEPRFYAQLLEMLGIDPATLPDRGDRASWPVIRSRLAETFKSRDRDAWAGHFEGSDACVTPVLSFSEAQCHPHSVARGAFPSIAGVPQPAPGPFFSRTSTSVRRPPPRRGQGARQALADWGVVLGAASGE